MIMTVMVILWNCNHLTHTLYYRAGVTPLLFCCCFMNSNNDPWFYEVKCIELKKKPVIIEIQLTNTKNTNF